MQHFPIFVATGDQSILVAGQGEAAVAKIRLLLKSSASLHVFAPEPHVQIQSWADAGEIHLHRRVLGAGDVVGALLVYAANDDAQLDQNVIALARAQGVLVNVVDNLQASDFITPAIVDRDPITVAIGTEGTAPVLARAIKSDIEALLPATLGSLARLAAKLRVRARVVMHGHSRRMFWRDFFFSEGRQAFEAEGEAGVEQAFTSLLDRYIGNKARITQVVFVGTGSADPELLTLKARKVLDQADVVIHDQALSPAILELARREAPVICVDSSGVDASADEQTIHQLLARHAHTGACVVRLTSGNLAEWSSVEGEIALLNRLAIDWYVIPGVAGWPTSFSSLGRARPTRSSGYCGRASRSPEFVAEMSAAVQSDAEQHDQVRAG